MPTRTRGASHVAQALAKHGLEPRMDEVYQAELANLAGKARDARGERKGPSFCLSGRAAD